MATLKEMNRWKIDADRWLKLVAWGMAGIGVYFLASFTLFLLELASRLSSV